MSREAAGFGPGAVGHGSVGPDMRHDASCPGLFMPPPGVQQERTFSANISFSAWRDPGSVPQCGSLLSQARWCQVGNPWDVPGRRWFVFPSRTATPGLAPKTAKSTGLLRCFENHS